VEIDWHPDARIEYSALPPNERRAMDSAFDKLEALGDQLAAPPSSSIKGAEVTLRELRPRAGRSPWRAFYRRIGPRLVIGSVGPEAMNNRRGFDQAVRAAIMRLAAVEDEEL
jgi:phage-related protein